MQEDMYAIYAPYYAMSPTKLIDIETHLCFATTCLIKTQVEESLLGILCRRQVVERYLDIPWHKTHRIKKTTWVFES